MLYGDEKLFHMAKSILPSTARRWARWKKANIKRKARRKGRELCRRAARDHEDDCAVDADYTGYPDRKINSVRNRRRGSDKLAHFERWALKKVSDREDNPGGNRSYMKSILPNGLIGDHAISHLENYSEFERDWIMTERYGRYVRNRHYYGHEKIVQALWEIAKNPKARALLNGYVRRSHKNADWTVGYTRKRDDRDCHHVDSWGKMAMTGPLIPVVIKMAGEAPELRPGQAAQFYARTLKAAYRDRWAAVPADMTVGLMFPAVRLRNPEWHPEWRSSIRSFCGLWFSHKNDLDKIREKLPTWGIYY